MQAILLCGNFDPKLPLGSFLDADRRYVEVVRKLLTVASLARQAGVGEVQKIVQVSRTLPWRDGDWQDSVGELSAKKGKGRPIQAVLDAVSGSCDAPVFQEFREVHGKVEQLVRGAGFNYAIVRAPPTVRLTRAGAKYEMLLLQSPSDLSAVARAAIEGEDGDGALSLSIGQLDLGETAVQALLSEESGGKTFTVCEDPLDPILRRRRAMALRDTASAASAAAASPGEEEETVTSRRPARNTYYGILSMTDDDMRSSYVIRPENSYIEQFTEDELVEKYWNGLLKDLNRDI